MVTVLYFIGILHWLNELQHSVPNPMVAVLCFMLKYSYVDPPPQSRPQFWYHVHEKRVYLAGGKGSSPI